MTHPYFDVADFSTDTLLAYWRWLCRKTPTMFKESTGAGTNVYLANLNEYIPFLGDLHEQMKDVPDGGEVRIIVGPKPKKPG